ncbi:MAG: SocA family protein [Tenacibaculum sp.]|nr:SocA family protein [Tenacibaculum sp.]
MKFLNPILYILNRVGKPVNKYNILKILYFADQKCLVNYNQKVTEDWYEKNEYGPVAYHTYDLLKAVEGRNQFLPVDFLSSYLKKVGKHSFKALQKVDLEEFTTVQIECLNEAIDENIGLNFQQLLDKSHDDAYNVTEALYQEIDKYEIAKAGGANDEQIAYMKEMDKIQNSEWA